MRREDVWTYIMTYASNCTWRHQTSHQCRTISRKSVIYWIKL